MEKEGKLGASQNQVHDIIFNQELNWKEIIFDLINTEQLDPWDVDISVLADRFFDKIQEYQELDFFVSSKVILAASLLLRLKSELILSKYVRGIDDILFGKEEINKNKNSLERIELDEEIPDLILKTPMPRYKRVTLNELIESLNKAIITENRRIKKTIVNQNALRQAGIILPKKHEGIGERIKKLQNKLTLHFKENKKDKRIKYTDFVGGSFEEKRLSFFPMLQLETNGEIWLEQENVFEDIFIWIKEVYLRENPKPFGDLNFDETNLTSEELKKLDEIEKMGDLLGE